MSGGVDSTAAAVLLCEKGFEVIGLYLDIGTERSHKEGEAAATAARALGIILKKVNIAARLEEQVCSVFVSEYLEGKTPNPCILCNPLVKFRAMAQMAGEVGADYIATGHYARAKYDPQYGRAVIKKALRGVDQSYMLYRLPREYTDMCLFPLGDMEKRETRALVAKTACATTAEKPDSMEICFIPDGDYAAYIAARGIKPPPGFFVDTEGRILGRHKGIHHYTVGQRRGLGVSAGRPMYVCAIQREDNLVVMAESGGEFADKITLTGCIWRLWDSAPDTFDGEVKVRYSRNGQAGHVHTGQNGEAEITFDEPVRAPAPGQSAVVYIGDTLAGGGFIT